MTKLCDKEGCTNTAKMSYMLERCDNSIADFCLKHDDFALEVYLGLFPDVYRRQCME